MKKIAVLSMIRASKKTIGMWLVSIILCAVSLEGILSFPNLLKSNQTLPQNIVVIAHALYVIGGIIIVIGIWRSLNITSTIVILWGIGSLGAGVGGPLAFSGNQPVFLRTAVILAAVIIILTVGLFLYTRDIVTRK